MRVSRVISRVSVEVLILKNVSFFLKDPNDGVGSFYHLHQNDFGLLFKRGRNKSFFTLILNFAFVSSCVSFLLIHCASSQGTCSYDFVVCSMGLSAAIPKSCCASRICSSVN